MTVHLPIPKLIDRPRVLRLMQQALQVSHLFLTAPAGYGKTTALNALTTHRQDTYLLQLTLADRDVTVLQARVAPLLQPNHTLILDDVHMLAGSPETIAWLHSHLEQPRPRWLLAGRFLPADFEADLFTIDGRATHLTRDALALTLAEAKMLLGSRRPSVAGWHERLQGWPLPLALLARLPATEDRDPLPIAEAQLFRYLAATVFDRLPPDLYRFMQATAVPLRFNLDLARKLWPRPAEAQALLADVRRRSLFLQTDDRPGWWRYHDLIRDFLRRSATFDTAPLARQAVAFFQELDDLENAIEHALAAGLESEAAGMLMAVSDTFLWDHARHLTFHRWVHTLSAAAQEAHPQLWVRLAQSLHYLPGRRAEAWDYLQKAEARFAATDQADALRQLQQHKAWFHSAEGDVAAALQALARLLADAAISGVARLQLLYQAGAAHATLGDFTAAEQVLDGAVAMARAAGDERRAAALGEKLALYVYIPRGRFKRAAAAMAAVLPHYADRPSYQIQYLLIVADLYSGQGDWPRLAAAVDDLRQLLAGLEQPESHQRLWSAFNEGWLAAATGAWADYEAAFARARAISENDPVANLSLARLALWAARSRNRPLPLDKAAAALSDPAHNAVYYRAVLALEIDIAAGLAWRPDRNDSFTLHPETGRLVGWRCRADLVRLRALLAVVAHRAGDPRWRRHLRAALFGLRYAGSEHLLTRRDPALGAAFWPLALLEEETAGQAAEALVTLGQIEPLLPLLRHADAAVRLRGADVLRQLGRETAVPHLNRAQKKEKDPAVQEAIGAAVTHLVTLPPPLLTVRCFGSFSLQRGGAAVPAEAWPRPIVYRLFCYFALHRGHTLSRDHILDELWPHTDPHKAWNIFRTIFSGLRKVLEPHLPPKAPLRYIQVTGELYRVDPHGRMRVDARDFEETVTGILARQDDTPLSDLLDPLLGALREWRPLLPDLPLEDWLVTPRQRLQELYIEGCLLAGQGLLAAGEHAPAVHWALQATGAAPWLEEGYQLLMRAYARQGQRTQALQIYETAVANLRHELDIPPSPLTDWLAGRLRRGEGI